MKTKSTRVCVNRAFNRVLNLGIICCLFFGAALVARGTASVSVVVDMSSTGFPPPTDFAGLSFETVVLETNGVCPGFLFDTNITRSPTCNQVLTLCTNMGLKEIRIGAASVDTAVPLVDYDYNGIDAFFNFMSKAGIDVIYSLRCINSSNGDNYATADGQIAHHIWTNSTEKAVLNSLTIGNEPSAYPDYDISPPITDYTDFQNKWQAIANIVVSNTDPSVKFVATDGKDGSNWTARFITNKVNGVITNHILDATQHYYPGGAGGTNITATQAIKDMLSAEWVDTEYPKWFNANPPHWDNGFWNFRVTEADDHYTAGTEGASDRFAAALWGLDFLCWQAQTTNCMGVNFHNTFHNINNLTGAWSLTLQYTNGYFQATPKWAAIKMFTLLYNGKTTVKSGVITNASGVNVTVYASGDSTNCYALLINKSNPVTGDGANVNVTVFPTHFTAHNAQYMRLSSYPSSNDPTQPQALLGGATITNNAAWTGTWSSLPVVNNTCTTNCGQASALLVHMF